MYQIIKRNRKKSDGIYQFYDGMSKTVRKNNTEDYNNTIKAIKNSKGHIL